MMINCYSKCRLNSIIYMVPDAHFSQYQTEASLKKQFPDTLLISILLFAEIHVGLTLEGLCESDFLFGGLFLEVPQPT